MDVGVVAGYMKDMMEHRLPLTPGIDLSGVVHSVGDGVAWKVGDEVFGSVEKPFMGEGTFAEQVVHPGQLARREAGRARARASGRVADGKPYGAFGG